MRSLRDRLRGLERGGNHRGDAQSTDSSELRARLDRLLGPGRVVPGSALPDKRAPEPVDRFVPGRRVGTPSGRVFVTEWVGAGSGRHGRMALGELAGLPWPDAVDLFPEQLAGLQSPAEVAFLDTETTGLAGGAGTIPFLVGVARWDTDLGGVRVVQLFLEDLDGEAALLERLAVELEGVRCLVTYNGRCYDVPLLETRHVLNRKPWPLPDAAHLDLLHPARVLWRHAHPDCRLATLEARVLGHSRCGDIPGAEIPALYNAFLRRGATERLAAVFSHNRDDLLSLAGLLWLATQTGAAPSLGRGLLQARGGRLDAALPHLEAGLDERAPLEVRVRALREIVRARKRQGDWTAALDACARLRRLAPGDPRGYAEAAIVLEHRLGRPAEALAVVEEALSRGLWPRLDREGLEQRRGRLSRRLEPGSRS